MQSLLLQLKRGISGAALAAAATNAHCFGKPGTWQNTATAASRTFSAAASSPSGIASLDEVRTVIKLEGPTLIPYLQRVITSDARQIGPGAPPLYSALLTPQGRFAHDLLIHAVAGTDLPTVLVDCDAAHRRLLMDLLQRYSVHHKIDISSAGKHFMVMTAFGGNGIAGASTALVHDWPADPRLLQLGRRTILPRGSAPAPTASWQDYQCWRIQHGVAEGDVEIPSGEANPLEANLDKLNAIRFDKGCYIGQEFVARVHARGCIRKRIMPFQIGTARGAGCISSVNLDPRSAYVFDVFDAEESLVPIGRVRAVQGKFGLAKIRLKQAMAALREAKPLLVGDLEAGTGYAEIWPFRPNWWEGSWGYEESQEGEELERRAA